MTRYRQGDDYPGTRYDALRRHREATEWENARIEAEYEDKLREERKRKERIMSAGGILAVGGVLAVGIGIAALSTTYIVDEGRVGVVVNMGRAVEQVSPAGLQFKAPFITSVKEFDVRERSVSQQFNATTSNQLSSTMDVTYNLRPDPAQIMDIFVKYGSPAQFFDNVISPRLNQSSKATAGTFTSVQLARERDAVAEAMFQNAVETLQGYPVIVTSAQLDSYTLPDRYWAAILDKEEQRERTDKERLLLEQQGVQAQQVTQTAQAQAAADIAQADAEAYRTRVQAEAEAESVRLRATAEADGIALMNEALAANPLLVEYQKAKSWNGVLPSTVMGGRMPQMLMNLPVVEDAR
jgi:membrane protease subunit HflC